MTYCLHQRTHIRTHNTDGFWSRVEQLEWEPSTIIIFRNNIDSSTTVIDFGAWTGVTTLLAAQLAKRVISLEPDRVAHQVLVANLKLNPQFENVVTLFNCISVRREMVVMAAGPYHQGTQAIRSQSQLIEY